MDKYIFNETPAKEQPLSTTKVLTKCKKTASQQQKSSAFLMLFSLIVRAL